MSAYCCAESLFGALHEVAAAAAVAVDLYSSGHHIHTFGINEFGSYYGEVAVGDLKNFIVAHKNRPILKPSGGGEYLSVDYLR